MFTFYLCLSKPSWCVLEKQFISLYFFFYLCYFLPTKNVCANFRWKSLSAITSHCGPTHEGQGEISEFSQNYKVQLWPQMPQMILQWILSNCITNLLECNERVIEWSCYRHFEWKCCIKDAFFWQHNAFKVNLFPSWWSWEMGGALPCQLAECSSFECRFTFYATSWTPIDSFHF